MRLRQATLIVLSLAGMWVAGSAVSQQANNGSGLQYIRLDDPVYGVPEGNLAFFAGWKGTATIERQDPQCRRCPYVAFHMTSPDGTQVIQQMAVPLHTTMVNIPAQYRPANVVITRFNGTGDLLTRYVLPQLHLAGQAGSPVELGQERITALRRKLAEKGMGDFRVDIAGVRLANAKPGKDFFVVGVTFSNGVATQGETSLTTIDVLEAPSGKAEALATACLRLPVLDINPSWERMEENRQQNDMAQSRAVLQQQMSKAASSQTAISNGHAAASNDSNAIARQGAADRAAQNNSDFAKQNQLTQDSGTLSKGAQNGNGSSFKYCNAANQTTWVYNSLNPPTAPGGPWWRCN